MKLLALETATAAGAVALVLDGTVAAEIVTTTTRQHTETLLPAAVKLLAGVGLVVGDLDAVVVDVGPGLFTGLRVGVATARSLALSAGIGLEAVTSLEVLAADPATEGASSVIALVDARRGEVFAQHFAVTGDQRHPRGEPAVLRPDALGAWAVSVEPEAGRLVIVGDGAVRYAEAAQVLGGEILSSVTIPSPGVAALLVERRGRRGPAPESVVPLYLRDPDAVANFTVAPAGRLT